MIGNIHIHVKPNADEKTVSLSVKIGDGWWTLTESILPDDINTMDIIGMVNSIRSNSN